MEDSTHIEIYFSEREKELSERRDRVGDLMSKRVEYLSKKYGLPLVPEVEFEQSLYNPDVKVRPDPELKDLILEPSLIPGYIFNAIRVQEFHIAGYAYIDRRYRGLLEEQNRLNELIPSINCSDAA